jgi:hypothetical protein
VIILPPGVDPGSVIPLPATPTLQLADTAQPPAPTSTGAATATPLSTLALTPDLTPVAPGETPPSGIPTTPTVAEVGALPVPQATPTPQQPPSPILIPTDTPVSLPTATPTPSPTPFVLVEAGLVNLRAGPGVDYPLVAQLGPNIPVAIVGQNPEGAWYQICCVNGDSVWVAKNHVMAINDTTTIGLVLSGAPPTPTATGTPTQTPTITPTPTATAYPFQILEGPLYFPTGNEMLTIWVKVVDGGGGPQGGYHLKVLYRNRADGSAFEDRPNTRGEQPSSDTLEYNVPAGTGAGNRVQYNYKFEFLPPDPRAEDPASTATRLSLIDGYWRIYLTDGAGTQLSNAIEFNTLAGNNRREVYVAWVRN